MPLWLHIPVAPAVSTDSTSGEAPIGLKVAFVLK